MPKSLDSHPFAGVTEERLKEAQIKLGNIKLPDFDIKIFNDIHTKQ
jgi:hypothetical protein